MENAIARKLDPPEINPIEIVSGYQYRCRWRGLNPKKSQLFRHVAEISLSFTPADCRLADAHMLGV